MGDPKKNDTTNVPDDQPQVTAPAEQPKNKPAGKQKVYKVLSPILRNNKLLSIGEKISLPEKEAEVLVKSKAVEVFE